MRHRSSGCGPVPPSGPAAVEPRPRANSHRHHRGPFCPSIVVVNAWIGGDRALRSLQELVGRKERMMLFRRLILVIALMIYHSEINTALAILAPACPDRHAEGM